MYDLYIKLEADKIFKKLANRNPKQLAMINDKISDIRNNPQHNYKFLKKPLQNFNRVHIDGSFVLIFKISNERKTVDIYYYNHHDNVYQWRPKKED